MTSLSAIAESAHDHLSLRTGRGPDSETEHDAHTPTAQHDSFTPRGSPRVGSQRLPPLSTKFPPVIPGTPSARTGPPASLNFDYATSRRGHESYFEESHESVDPSWRQAPQARPTLRQVDSEFRSALEYQDPEQREAEREMKEKREKRRHSRIDGEPWNMRRWFADSPKDESVIPDPLRKTPIPSRQGSGHDGRTGGLGEPSRSGTLPSARPLATNSSTPVDGEGRKLVRRSSSVPQLRRAAPSKGPGGPKWSRLRSLLPTIVSQGSQVQAPQTAAVVPHSVNITDELIAGGLSTLMLQLWFDRDERGHRRIPILLHRLRIRISDSLYPLSGHKAVFRIECEYANGASRWVVYRQLRDFLSLHTHYTVSNAYNRLQDNIPDFPRTSNSCLCRLEET
jgi:phospholipase D1/2